MTSAVPGYVPELYALDEGQIQNSTVPDFPATNKFHGVEYPPAAFGIVNTPVPSKYAEYAPEAGRGDVLRTVMFVLVTTIAYVLESGNPVVSHVRYRSVPVGVAGLGFTFADTGGEKFDV
jgi:hypothetical protein